MLLFNLRPQRRSLLSPARGRQRGVAAVEFAVILPLLLILLAGGLLAGRACWHYTVAQKAVQDAARFMATVPLSDLRSIAAAEAPVAVARWIAASETADLAPGGSAAAGSIAYAVSCDDGACGAVPEPKVVTVTIRVDLFDPVLPQWSGRPGAAPILPLSATAQVDHVAR